MNFLLLKLILQLLLQFHLLLDQLINLFNLCQML